MFSSMQAALKKSMIPTLHLKETTTRFCLQFLAHLLKLLIIALPLEMEAQHPPKEFAMACTSAGVN
jgi:hypothetical protein